MTSIGIDQATATENIADQVRELLGLTTSTALPTFAADLAQVNQTFVNLEPTLSALGISAAETATALQNAINQVTLAAQTQINTAEGNDYLNSMQSLTTSTSASTLSAGGLDAQVALAQAQQIISGLTEPQLYTALAEFGSCFECRRDLGHPMDHVDHCATGQYFSHRSAENFTANRDDSHAAFSNATGSLATFGTSLTTGSLSPLGPQGAYTAAGAQMQSDVMGIADGSLTSLSNFQSDVTTYLKDSQAMYATGPQYAADFATAQAAVAAAQESTALQATAQQGIINDLNAGLNQLSTGINNGSSAGELP